MGAAFEWDDTKAQSNLQKHGVSFDEAASVFASPLAAIFPDPDHSEDEVREIIVGHSERNRLLVVSFAERGDAVRIISARVATARERKDYEENPMGGWGHE
jgi:hypothetical protein